MAINYMIVPVCNLSEFNPSSCCYYMKMLNKYIDCLVGVGYYSDK